MPRLNGYPPGLPHPSRMFRYLALAAVLAVAACVWLTLQMPVSSVSLQPETKSDMITVRSPGARLLVGPDTLVTFRAPGEPAIQLTAVRAATDAPDFANKSDFTIAAWLAQGPVSVELRDTDGALRRFEMQRTPRTFGSLNANYWLNAIVGLLGLLLGIGVWVLQPSDRSAITYSIGAFALALAQITHGAELLVDAATGRGAYLTLIWPNALGLHLMAAAMFLLFLGFPTRLVSRRSENVVLAVVALLVIGGFAAFPFNKAIHSLPVPMSLFLLMSVLIAVQGWVARHDAARRTSLAIVVTAVLVGTAIYFLTTLLPTIFKQPSPIEAVVVVPIFLLIYASIGVAIAHRSSFALNGWAQKAFASVCLVGLVLLVDVVLIGFLAQQSGVALGLAFAIVAVVYLPVREWLSHRAERRRQAQARRTLRFATDLAFATQSADRIVRWREALTATFDPLELSMDPAPGSGPRIGEKGVALHFPRVAGAPALIARHANSGQRLFVPVDLETAQALIDMIERLVSARDAYMHGASEERQRIARDLHDDVSGRLMSSLHRNCADAMRHDVREAMADIRVIVNGLAAEPRALGELLADLRHESQGRLEACGVTLFWEAGRELEDPRLLDYPVYRHLVSVLRESISNIVRHAGASRVEISVQSIGEMLSIEIVDDGCGIDTDAEPGNGLRNCTRRAEALGGSFEISPAAAGSVVRFQMRINGAVAEAGGSL